MIERHAQAANFLLTLRERNQTASEIPTSYRPKNFEEAYRVQDELVTQLLQRKGGEILGYKIACTNPSAQKALCLDSPFFGTILSSTCLESGTTVDASRFQMRCIESEFAFRMAADVPPERAPYTQETIKEYVAGVLPAIEIVDSHFHDWAKVGAVALASDNAIHGAWIKGAEYADWPALDLSTHRTSLLVNDAEVRAGSGANVLGSPYVALAWLANELLGYGKQLKKGQYVSTGLTTEIYLGGRGDRIQADFFELGSVKMELV